MKLVTYQSDKGPRVAAMRDGAWVDLNQANPQIPRSLKQLLAQGDAGLAMAAEALSQAPALTNVRLCPPIPHPEKIICVGVNYAEHAREVGMEPPEEPVIFNKLPNTIRADGDEIVLPTCSDKVDYEAELVAVIGRAGKNIPRAEAMDHVAGFCCGNDVSARDWQKNKPAGQWLLGKTFDSFAPLGKMLVTRDEVGDCGQLDIQLRLNGTVMQQSNTRNLIFPVDYLIAYLSQVVTLNPGDLIFTGTPSGVGVGRKPPVFLKSGDVVEVEIEKLGVLRNPVVAA